MDKQILAPGIIMYRNVMPESEMIIDFINSNKLWEEGMIAGSRISSDEIALVYKDIRDVSIYVAPYNADTWISSMLKNSISVCEKDYISYYEIERDYIHEDFQIMKYEPGQKFTNHVDSQIEFPRSISTVYYFNDDYVGGHIYFDQFNLTVKPEAKSLLIFPSIWSYSHTAQPVEHGVKYAIVNFMN